jgi:hypothetical protein
MCLLLRLLYKEFSSAMELDRRITIYAPTTFPSVEAWNFAWNKKFLILAHYKPQFSGLYEFLMSAIVRTIESSLEERKDISNYIQNEFLNILKKVLPCKYMFVGDIKFVHCQKVLYTTVKYPERRLDFQNLHPKYEFGCECVFKAECDGSVYAVEIIFSVSDLYRQVFLGEEEEEEEEEK